MLPISLLPDIALNWDFVFTVCGILGVVMVTYSQFVEAENRRDFIRIIGAAALLVYALSILNLIFIAASVGIFFAALIEAIEIYFGLHHHTPDNVREYIKRYKLDKQK